MNPYALAVVALCVFAAGLLWAWENHINGPR